MTQDIVAWPNNNSFSFPNLALTRLKHPMHDMVKTLPVRLSSLPRPVNINLSFIRQGWVKGRRWICLSWLECVNKASKKPTYYSTEREGRYPNYWLPDIIWLFCAETTSQIKNPQLIEWSESFRWLVMEFSSRYWFINAPLTWLSLSSS